jgi:hypothetical protein
MRLEIVDWMPLTIDETAEVTLDTIPLIAP